MPSDAELRIRKARSQMLGVEPFYATIALGWKLQETPGYGTCGMDGESLFYDPEYVTKITMDELKGVMAHEATHEALGHHLRIGSRDLDDANRAADYAANPLVHTRFTLPKGYLYEKAFENKSLEEIYRIIHKEKPKGGGGGKKPEDKPQPGNQPGQTGNQPGQPGQGPPSPKTEGGFGQVLPSPAKTPDEIKAAEQKVKQKVVQAAMVAKAAGKLPGDLERLVDSICEPKLDWRSILRRFVAETVVSDYSWARPSRRFIGFDLYLPSTVKEGVGEIVVAVDCSGSITPELISQFSAEVQEIQQEVQPSEITVLYFDTRISHVDRFTLGDEFTLKAHGGGGTDFNCVFRWIDDQGVIPKALVVLTDLYGPYQAEEPCYPTLWACTSHKKAAWGETVPFELVQ